METFQKWEHSKKYLFLGTLWIGVLPNSCCWATGSEGLLKQSRDGSSSSSGYFNFLHLESPPWTTGWIPEDCLAIAQLLPNNNFGEAELSLQTGFHPEAWIWLPLGYPAMPSRWVSIGSCRRRWMCRSVTGVPELMQSDGPGKAEGLRQGTESRIKEHWD